jgi:3-deoxy-D-manno-octulosonate 8-phosphate phosphatase (KDO 8-P phosphatase)
MMDHQLFNQITTFVFDVDGVFTNSEVLVMENGDLLRTMNTRDGQAVKIALEAGYNMAIITKGFSTGVRKRFDLLGIEHIYDKVNNKTEALADLMIKLSIQQDEILYMGDDIPDIQVLGQVGVSSCPHDAVPEVMQKVQYISAFKGGNGCVRDVIEKVMKIQGKWTF